MILRGETDTTFVALSLRQTLNQCVFLKFWELSKPTTRIVGELLSPVKNLSDEALTDIYVKMVR